MERRCLPVRLRSLARLALGVSVVAQVAAAGVAVDALGAHPAAAQVGVGGDGSRASVSGYRAGGAVHVGYGVSGPLASTVTCRELVSETSGMVDADGGAASPGWPPLEPGRVARSRYWLDCRHADGTAVALGAGALGFLYEDEIIDVDAVVRTLAERYAGETLAPAMSIGLSPPAGLVGVEQWFWVAGWDGAPVRERHDVVGHAVDVELRLAGVGWSFGPAAEPVEAGLGEAGAGTVAHTFQVRSTSDAAPAAALRIGATVRIAASYTLDGAGPFDVTPAIEVPLASTLVVREAQAVVHR